MKILFNRHNICIIDTVYALFIYMMYVSERAFWNTHFYISDGISPSIWKNLPHVTVLPYEKYHRLDDIKKFRHSCLLSSPKRFFSKFYAQDHLPFAPALIGTHQYTYIEDSPRIFSNYKNYSCQVPIHQRGLLWSVKAFINWGPIYKQTLGTNKQCENRIITYPFDAETSIASGRKCSILNYLQIWNESENKRNLVTKVFNLQSIPQHYLNSKVILFTQALMSDCQMTEDEIISIYKPYIEKFKEEGILIKRHPRDSIDYSRYFPDVPIICTPAPMQVLECLGCNYETAITICSTSIFNLPEKTNIIWIGTAINNKIAAAYGNPQKPR